MKLLNLLPVFIVAANAAAIHDKRADNQPIVILDEKEPHLKTEKFKNGSWGSSCDWNDTEGAMVCEITNIWGAFAAEPKLSYTGGTLAITMKVKDKSKKVQLQCSRPNEKPEPYHNFATNIQMDTTYKEYTFDVPDYVNDSQFKTHDPVISLAIQASGEKNTFYIKKMVYTPGPKSTFEPIVKANNNAQQDTTAKTNESTTSQDTTAKTNESTTSQDTTAKTNDNPQDTTAGTNDSTAKPSDSNQTNGNTANTAQPSGTKTTTTTPSGDKTNGSTTVKVVLFNIVVAQLILLLLL